MRPTATSRTRITASLLLLAGSAAAAPAPAAPRGRPAEYEAAQRFMRGGSSWQPMEELVGRLEFEGRQPAREVTLGSYYRALDWLKLGGFLSFRSGVRHDDDWSKSPQGVWEWRDVSDRTEPVLVLDATPRATLPWLPGRSWVGAVKARFEQDWYDGQSVLRLEPELSYFYMEGLQPLWHVSARYEAALDLNFGPQEVGEQWVYLTALWHAPHDWVAGPHVAVGEQVFGTSRAFSDATGGAASYVVRWQSMRLGFDVVRRF
ncbi:MAG: hypothetical protein KGL53_09290 [Elusimicrobia bacterium]|nr:hypothetical protein [Elusimicrobiota bacterium]